MRRGPVLCGGPLRLATPLVVAVVLSACSGGGGSAAPAPTSAAPSPVPVVTPVLPSCAPVPAAPGFAWPKPVPADLPVPPGGALSDSRTTADGLTVVEFSTQYSLRDGVVFLVERLGKAGYTLGRGDAEATEADAPFAKADLRGVFRLIARTSCRTDWLLAVTRRQSGGTGSPLLPMRPGAGSPSPLPFG